MSKAGKCLIRINTGVKKYLIVAEAVPGNGIASFL
jgi:hypothetical protein